jgi:hypothetical protein
VGVAGRYRRGKKRTRYDVGHAALAYQASPTLRYRDSPSLLALGGPPAPNPWLSQGWDGGDPEPGKGQTPGFSANWGADLM